MPTPEGGADGARCGLVNLQAYMGCLPATQTHDPRGGCYQFKLLITNPAAPVDPNAVGLCVLNKGQAIGWFGNLPLWDPIFELNGPAWQSLPASTPQPVTLEQLPAQQVPAKGIEPNPSP